MKKFLFLVFLFFVVISTFFSYVLLEKKKPHRYRITSDGFRLTKQIDSKCWSLDKTGLKDMYLAGSGHLKINFLNNYFFHQFPKTYIFSITFADHDIYYYKKKDLQKYFGLTLEEQRIKFRTPHKFRYIIRRFFYGLPFHAKDYNALGEFYESEDNAWKNKPNVYYKKIASPKWLFEPFYIDDLIKDFKNIPEGSAVYFHCEHGKGRTTAFMILYDIFKNHQYVSIKDLIVRHYCIGGEDIYNIIPLKKATWRPEGLLARKRLLELFYFYMEDKNQGYGIKSWSSWIKDKGYISELQVKKYKYQ